MDLKEITNEYEKKEITKFLNNKPLVNAVKRVLLAAVYRGKLEPGVEPDPTKNFMLGFLYTEDLGVEFAIDDKRLGEKTRAVLEAIKMVQVGFGQLEKMKEEEKPKEAEEVSGR